MALPLRVALVGYGLAGRFFHAPLIAATPDFAISSVITRDPERRAAAQQEIAGVQMLDTLDELWARAGDHNVVVVATPNRMHAAVARAALEAGLHVVVEKPFAAHAEDARALVHLAQSRDRVLTVFHNRRWDGDFLTISQILDTGSIGTVTRFESRFERWQPDPHLSAWRQGSDPDAAGGLVYDLGSHLVDQAIRLFGRPSSIYAEMASRRPGVAVDDDSFIALEHADGVRSHLSMSAVAALPAARFRVLGSTGAYAKDGLDIQEEQLRAGLRPGDTGFAVEPVDRWGRLFSNGQGRSHPTRPGRWVDFYPLLSDAIRNGAPPPVDPNDAVVVIEVLEAALQSARTGSVWR
ncbi:MAG TPA: Gfo/Idh/MocA family oxidoreductase [Candidatus Acidoferrales bacterium]|jgi:scyllo-inositol 2-dehydrogenase (NADP+)|nr:Gfo/Idh/MocA family oxidoreductase [Candidatus Acidoferrales bacterium]